MVAKGCALVGLEEGQRLLDTLSLCRRVCFSVVLLVGAGGAQQ